MQYVVQVSGEVLDKQNRAYVVESKTDEEAQLIATQAFCENFAIESPAVQVKSNKRTYKAIAAFIFMLIPALLSFIKWKNGHDTVSISPDYLSCLYGALIYAAFIVRFKGIQRAVSSWIDILFCVFAVLLLSSFVKTILVAKTIRLFGLTDITINTNVILPVAIILSWLGLRTVSLVCMGGVAMIALFNITALNTAMGNIFGPLYIICSFVGIMLYLSVEPAFIETLLQIKTVVARGMHRLSDDVTNAKTKAIHVKTAISNKNHTSNEQ